MKAKDFLPEDKFGTNPKRPARAGARPPRKHDDRTRQIHQLHGATGWDVSHLELLKSDELDDLHKKHVDQKVSEVYDGEPDEYHAVRQQSKKDIELGITKPAHWDKLKQFDSYQEAKKFMDDVKAKDPTAKLTISTHKKKSVAEGVDIGQEWMSDTELDQYVPERLQQQWRELLGYDENGNPSALWANLTGGYEPDVNDPQHRRLMVKVANKWFAAKKIPNVKFFDVKDADDELEWLVQIGQQGVAEGTEQFCENCGGSLAEAGKASRALCVSGRPDNDLGASNLASCKSQGLRARDGEKSHKLGKTTKSRIKVGGHRIKGNKYGGPLPDWS